MLSWHEFQKKQPLAGKIITNSILRNRISHAYLIQGMRGTGRKTMATLIAMTMLCGQKSGIEPCGDCHVCKRIKSGNHPDVHWLQPEGQSIKTDEISSLKREFGFTAFEQEKKVYIITEAEKLTTNAANRILKYLEEPDQDITAILITNNGQRVLKTIRSRCQILDFQPLDSMALQYSLTNIKEPLISENNARLLSALTNNIDEALSYHDIGKVYQIRDMIKELLATVINKHEARYLFVHSKWLSLLTDKKEHDLGLELLILALGDILNTKIDRKDKLMLFQGGEGLLNKAVISIPDSKLIQMIREVLNTRGKLQQNIHPTLLMERLVLNF